MGDSKENENFETEPFANENIQTNNQYVNRISNYGNRRFLEEFKKNLYIFLKL